MPKGIKKKKVEFEDKELPKVINQKEKEEKDCSCGHSASIHYGGLNRWCNKCQCGAYN